MNKTLLAIGSFFVIGIVIGSQLRGCHTAPCAGIEVTHIRHDTLVSYIYGDTSMKQVEHQLPRPYRVTGGEGRRTSENSQPNIVDGRQPIANALHPSSPASCISSLRPPSLVPSISVLRPPTLVPFILDTAYYSDSIRSAEDFKAVINDTISGSRILGRSVWFADLKPAEVKTVTNTVTLMKKQAFLKIYLGADAYGGRMGGRYSFDIAPAASVVFADRYMVDLGYYILNEQVTAGLKVKLSFRK